MNCVVCGRESTKPVCEVCARRLSMDYPFLLHRGFLVGDFESESLEPDSTPMLFRKDLEVLNNMAKRALMGEKVNNIVLAKYAIYFHEHFSFLLENIEIDPHYYLILAEKFASMDEDPDSRYYLALSNYLRGEKEVAEEILAEIWNLDRKYALLYGRVLTELGKWGRAIEIYNEILGENKEDKDAWKFLADALFTSGNYEDAERAYLRVLQIDKNDYEAWFKRGLCLKKMGKWGGALQSFQTAARKNPKFRDAYEKMVEILIERGMYSRAMETLKRMKEQGWDVDERIRRIRELVEDEGS